MLHAHVGEVPHDCGHSHSAHRCDHSLTSVRRCFETLEERFGCEWSVLRRAIVNSVAEPQTRDEEEVEKAFSRFKLAYKEACVQRFRNQRTGPLNSFYRDVFNDKDGFMEYLRSGTVAYFQNLRG